MRIPWNRVVGQLGCVVVLLGLGFGIRSSTRCSSAKMSPGLRSTADRVSSTYKELPNVTITISCILGKPSNKEDGIFGTGSQQNEHVILFILGEKCLLR